MPLPLTEETSSDSSKSKGIHFHLFDKKKFSFDYFHGWTNFLGGRRLRVNKTRGKISNKNWYMKKINQRKWWILERKHFLWLKQTTGFVNPESLAALEDKYIQLAEEAITRNQLKTYKSCGEEYFNIYFYGCLQLCLKVILNQIFFLT